MTENWQTTNAIIRDPTGLHARPAVKLTKLAKKFESRVEIRPENGDNWVNAKSPNAVMKMRAAHRATIEIRASGADAPSAIAALRSLIDGNFDELTTG